nr:hypothetical protein [uncultured Sphingomonas sp.]
MSIRLLAAAAVTCLFSHAAIAQDAPIDPTKPVQEKKLCRSVTPTGSVMSKRICLTKTEWAKLNGEYEKRNEAFRENQSRGGQLGAQ